LPRIVGVDIPKNKRIEISLTYIYGIGLTKAREILARTNIDTNTRAHQLTEGDVRKINNAIADLGIKVEGDARRIVSQNIKRLMSINAYRGERHKRGLPVRGQNTHSNARTRKGPRKGGMKSG
jgi:small subunit ribosomal protein S13